MSETNITWQLLGMTPDHKVKMKPRRKKKHRRKTKSAVDEFKKTEEKLKALQKSSVCQEFQEHSQCHIVCIMCLVYQPSSTYVTAQHDSFSHS